MGVGEKRGKEIDEPSPPPPRARFFSSFLAVVVVTTRAFFCSFLAVAEGVWPPVG